MIKFNLQLFGGRGGESGMGHSAAVKSAKVTSSGYAPQSIKASSESEAVALFKEANTTSKGTGYKISNKGYGKYSITKTFNGKTAPDGGDKTTVTVERNKDGTYGFRKY